MVLMGRPRGGLSRYGGGVPDAGVSRERDHRAVEPVCRKDAGFLGAVKAHGGSSFRSRTLSNTTPLPERFVALHQAAHRDGSLYYIPLVPLVPLALLALTLTLQNSSTTEPFLQATHALLAHSQAHRGVVKLRDQKQLDFEELSAYLSAVVSERDRLAALSSGHTAAPVGLGTYLRDQVDRLRGTDDVHTRRERMRKMDGKIKEVRVGGGVMRASVGQGRSQRRGRGDRQTRLFCLATIQTIFFLYFSLFSSRAD